MGQIVPDAIERYIAGLNRGHDRVLDDIERDGAARGLPLVDAEVGALLAVLVAATGASRVLEIGTAVGYSGIWLARGLPAGGMLLTMERSRERAAEANANFVRAGVAGRTSVIVGDAQLKLAKVAGPFDLIFQDGDKRLYLPMLDRLVALLRPGGLLITDNVLWAGEVVPGYVSAPRHEVEDTQAIVEYNDRLAAHPQLTTCIVPLRDGVSISVKASDASERRSAES